MLTAAPIMYSPQQCNASLRRTLTATTSCVRIHHCHITAPPTLLHGIPTAGTTSCMRIQHCHITHQPTDAEHYLHHLFFQILLGIQQGLTFIEQCVTAPPPAVTTRHTLWSCRTICRQMPSTTCTVLCCKCFLQCQPRRQFEALLTSNAWLRHILTTTLSPHKAVHCCHGEQTCLQMRSTTRRPLRPHRAFTDVWS